ncbi:MAG: LLM class flavin-dependent oxidoreductase, partial [Pseudomonadales bacterium]
GKSLADFDIAAQIMTATGLNDEQMAQAIDSARNQIAFYGSTPAYKPVLDQHDWGDLQPQLNALSKEGKWAEMSALISDEVLETIALFGTPEEIGEKVRAGRGSLVDRISPVAYTQNSSLLKKVADEIRGISDKAD